MKIKILGFTHTLDEELIFKKHNENLSYKMKAEDKRQPEWKQEKQKYGFNETALWGLTHNIAHYILPRLYMHRKWNPCYPANISQKTYKKQQKSLIKGLYMLCFEGKILEDIEKQNGSYPDNLYNELTCLRDRYLRDIDVILNLGW